MTVVCISLVGHLLPSRQGSKRTLQRRSIPLMDTDPPAYTGPCPRQKAFSDEGLHVHTSIAGRWGTPPAWSVPRLKEPEPALDRFDGACVSICCGAGDEAIKGYATRVRAIRARMHRNPVGWGESKQPLGGQCLKPETSLGSALGGEGGRNEMRIAPPRRSRQVVD